MLTEYSVVAATYGDLPEADAVFSAVELMYEERGSMSAFDAVTIGRKASGEARFGSRHLQRRAGEGDEIPGWSLAAGLAAASYPSVGVDLSAEWLEEFEVLSASAGFVQRALDRRVLKDLGEHLDSGPAGLIVVCRPALEEPVVELASESNGLISLHLSVDVEAIIQACQHSAALRAGP